MKKIEEIDFTKRVTREEIVGSPMCWNSGLCYKTATKLNEVIRELNKNE